MLRLLAIAVLLTRLVVPALAADRTLGERIGLQVKFNQGQPPEHLGIVDELGVRWVREHVSWRSLEPTAGRLRGFPPAFRHRLVHYRERDIGVIFVLGLSNPDAYPPTADDPYRAVNAQAFGRYALEVAAQLRASGVRFVLEVWNEPHGRNFELAPLLGGDWTGKHPSPWLDRYVRLVHEVVRQVKGFDASIPVMSSDDMWVVHYWMLEAGLPRELDGFAFHPYVRDVPERTAVSQTTAWVHPFVVVDADRSFSSAARRLREQGRKKLGKTPRLWITEWGWAVGEPTPAGQMTEELVAAYLPRAYVLATEADVEVLSWFSAWDAGDGPMGLVALDGRRRPAFHALRVLVQQLGDYTLVAHTAGAERPTRGLQVYTFRRGQNTKLVAWTVDGVAELALELPSAQVRAVDLMGRELTPSADSAQRSRLTVGRDPIYVGLKGDRPR